MVVFFVIDCAVVGRVCVPCFLCVLLRSPLSTPSTVSLCRLVKVVGAFTHMSF